MLEPVVFIAAVAISAVIQLFLGVAIGWWWRGSAPALSAKPAEPPSEDAERARLALDRLRELANSMAANVGEHSSRVQAITDELAATKPEDEGSLDAVLGTVARIIEANGRLQNQLATAEGRLEQQAQEIQVHAADALTDALTGQANRRAFDRELADQFALWEASKTPLSLMMIDVDHFKKFNDAHGHQAGDEVLRGVASVLASAMRETDVVARYGGEEFAVIMPATKLEEAKPAAERARAAIANAVFEVEGQQLRVTASEGLAEALTGEEIASLVKRADEALYAAKKAGRNQAHLHDGRSTAPAAEPPAGAPAAPPSAPAASAANFADKSAADDESLSRTDVQTGLPNRTSFCEDVRRRLAQAQREGGKLSLMLVKVDDLQELTRKHGKPVGDTVLRTVAQFLTAVMREMDVVARYEDEVFGVLLPGIPQSHAIGVAQRLRTTLANCPLRIKDQELRFTVSVGVAESVRSDDSASLIRRAQAATDASTEAGRDCVHFHNAASSKSCLAAPVADA